MIKKILSWLLAILAGIYILILGFLYFNQENMLFFPTKLEKDLQYHFQDRFEEVWIQTKDGPKLNALLFKSDSSKGVIFYLHGNAGALDSWGDIAHDYVARGYDMFILDYRGFGKSEGEITSQQQFYEDVQIAYDWVKSKYEEENIVVIGYSIGTGPAAMLAAKNHPKLLVLQAPYYSMTDMMHDRYPFVPGFLLKYKFPAADHIKEVKAPIIIFHGDEDQVIYYGSSEKLKPLLKPSDKMIPLYGQGHNGINNNPVYRDEIRRILR